MTPEDESDEEFLDDPIKLTDIEFTAVENAQHDDVSKTIDLTESDAEEIIPISKEALQKIVASNIPVTFFNIPRNVRFLYKCLPLSIKVVDCDKYPRYYRNVKRSAYDDVNVLSTINKHNNNETISTDTNIKNCTEGNTETNKMIVDENKAKLKIRPVASPYQMLKMAKMQKPNKLSKLTEVSSQNENIEENNMLQLLQHIDFKKNRGLIGLKITQINEISTSLSFKKSNIKNNDDVSQTNLEESTEYVKKIKETRLQDTIKLIKEKVCNKTRKLNIDIEAVTTESIKQTPEEAPTVKSVFFTEDENQKKNTLSNRRFGEPQENKIVSEIKCTIKEEKTAPKQCQDCDELKKTIIEKVTNKPSKIKKKKESRKKRTVKEVLKTQYTNPSPIAKETNIQKAPKFEQQSYVKKPYQRTPTKKITIRKLLENKSESKTDCKLLNIKPTATFGNLKQTNEKQKTAKQPKAKHFVNPKNVTLMPNKTLVVHNKQNCESSKDILENKLLATKSDSVINANPAATVTQGQIGLNYINKMATKSDLEIPPRSHVMTANPAATVTKGQVSSNHINNFATKSDSEISPRSHVMNVNPAATVTQGQISLNYINKMAAKSDSEIPPLLHVMTANPAVTVTKGQVSSNHINKFATKPDSEIPPRSHVMTANPTATVTKGQVSSNHITKFATKPDSEISPRSHVMNVNPAATVTQGQISLNNINKMATKSDSEIPLRSHVMTANPAVTVTKGQVSSNHINKFATKPDSEMSSLSHVTNVNPAATVTQGQISLNYINKLATMPITHISIPNHVSEKIESSIVGGEQYHNMSCNQTSVKPDIANNQNNNIVKNIKNNPSNLSKVLSTSLKMTPPCNNSQPNKTNQPTQLSQENNYINNNMAVKNSNMNCDIRNTLNNNLFNGNNMPLGIGLRQHYNPRGFNATMHRPPQPYMHRLPHVYHTYGPRHQNINNAIFNNRPVNPMYLGPNTNYETSLSVCEVSNKNTPYCTPNQNQLQTFPIETIMRERNNNYPTLQKCLQANIPNIPAARQRLNLSSVPIYEGIQQNMIHTQDRCQQLPTYPLNSLVRMPPPPPPPPPRKPPPLCVETTRHQCFNQNSNKGSISVPFKSYEGSTVIGQNMAGPIRKINIVAVPAANKKKAPPLADQNDIKIKLENVEPINTKIEMLEELKNSTRCASPSYNRVEENFKITASKVELSPKSEQKRTSPEILKNNVPLARKTFTGPLSKKPKLDRISTSPKNVVTGKGYSQPILPIPTYEETLEMLARKNSDATKCVDANACHDKQDKAAKKISLDEYKKRIEIKQEVE